MSYPVETWRKLNILCTFNLRPVSTGQEFKFEVSFFLSDSYGATLQQIKELINDFSENSIKNINSISKTHNLEMIHLLDLRLAFGRYETKLGKSVTELKILQLWKSRRRDFKWHHLNSKQS